MPELHGPDMHSERSSPDPSSEPDRAAAADSAALSRVMQRTVAFFGGPWMAPGLRTLIAAGVLVTTTPAASSLSPAMLATVALSYIVATWALTLAGWGRYRIVLDLAGLAVACLTLSGISLLWLAPATLLPISGTGDGNVALRRLGVGVVIGVAIVAGLGVTAVAAWWIAAVMLVAALGGVQQHERAVMAPSGDARSHWLARAVAEAEMGSYRASLVTMSIQWDDGMHRLFGLSPGEFSGRLDEFMSRIHPEDRDRVQRESWAAMLELRPIALEYRILWPNGSVHWLASRSQVWRTPLGVPQMSGLAWDVTDVREAQRELDENNRLLAASFQQSPIMQAVLDANGMILRLNDLGLAASLDEVERNAGRMLHDASWWVGGDETRAALRKALDIAVSGDVFRDTMMLVRANEAPVCTEVQLVPVRDDDGVVRWILFAVVFPSLPLSGPLG